MQKYCNVCRGHGTIPIFIHYELYDTLSLHYKQIRINSWSRIAKLYDYILLRAGDKINISIQQIWFTQFCNIRTFLFALQREASQRLHIIIYIERIIILILLLLLQITGQTYTEYNPWIWLLWHSILWIFNQPQQIIQKLQNSCVRFVYNLGYGVHITPF